MDKFIVSYLKNVVGTLRMYGYYNLMVINSYTLEASAIGPQNTGIKKRSILNSKRNYKNCRLKQNIKTLNTAYEKTKNDNSSNLYPTTASTNTTKLNIYNQLVEFDNNKVKDKDTVNNNYQYNSKSAKSQFIFNSCTEHTQYTNTNNKNVATSSNSCDNNVMKTKNANSGYNNGKLFFNTILFFLFSISTSRPN